jgi:hypothetical protein
MKIKCRIKRVSSDCTEILLYPQEKFDAVDICGETATLEVEGTTKEVFEV